MATAVNIPDLRPLSLGELLDRTFTYYRKHFWLFVGIMAVPSVFIVAVNISLVALESISSAGSESGGTATSDTLAMGATVSLAVGMVIMVVAYFVLYAVALGATTYALSEVHLGRLTSVRACYRNIRNRWGRLILLILGVLIRVAGIAVLFFVAIAATLAGVGSLGGGPLLVIAGLCAMLGMLGIGVLVVIMLLRYAVAIPALLLENLAAKAAIRRSIHLTKGNLGRVFLIGLLMSLVGWAVTMMCQGPFLVATMVMAVKSQAAAPLWLQVVSNIAGAVGQTLAGPLLMIGLALLYYDTRIRKEGLDLQLIMDALDQHRAPAAEQEGEIPDKLEEFSVLLTIFLTLITFWFYYPVWFMTRRRALNSLRSPEKLSLGVLGFIMVVWVVTLAISVAAGALEGAGGSSEAASWWANLSTPFELVGGVLILFQCFKVRRILLDHAETMERGLFSAGISFEQRTSFSAVATFFLGIWYLQYKINQFVELWEQQARVTSMEPAVPPA